MNIRPFTSNDFEAYVVLRNAVFPEYPFTVADMQHMEANHDPKCRRARFLAEQDGRVVGAGYYGNMPWMFHPQKFHVQVTVHPEHERRGIGRALADHLMAELATLNPLLLRNEVREDMTRGVQFAQRNGFKQEMRVWESRLDLRAFDMTPYADDMERIRAHGITIRSIVDLKADPERDHKLYDLMNEIERDVPSPDQITPMPFEIWRTSTFGSPSLMPEAFLVALDGDEYVGISTLCHRQANNQLEIGLTGVKRSHRRMGIAMALKLHNIAYAKQRGHTVISTENESNNHPMLSINERLGFVKQPAWINIAKDLAEVR